MSDSPGADNNNGYLFACETIEQLAFTLAFTFCSLHRADVSQKGQNSSPRLVHWFTCSASAIQFIILVYNKTAVIEIEQQ
mgnify:CR=1 FL=1